MMTRVPTVPVLMLLWLFWLPDSPASAHREQFTSEQRSQLEKIQTVLVDALALTDAGGADAGAIDAALADYFGRIDRGDPFDRETWLTTKGDLSPLLRGLIDADAWVGRLAGPRVSQLAGLAVSTSQKKGPSATSNERGLADSSPDVDSTWRGQNEKQTSKSEEPNGEIFGRYRLMREIGSGAMGTVRLAFDTELRRTVALKFPQPEIKHADAPERFQREARLLAQLQHPNIVPVYSMQEDAGARLKASAAAAGAT